MKIVINSMSKCEIDKISDVVGDTNELLRGAHDVIKKLESHP